MQMNDKEQNKIINYDIQSLSAINPLSADITNRKMLEPQNFNPLQDIKNTREKRFTNSQSTFLSLQQRSTFMTMTNKSNNTQDKQKYQDIFLGIIEFYDFLYYQYEINKCPIPDILKDIVEEKESKVEDEIKWQFVQFDQENLVLKVHIKHSKYKHLKLTIFQTDYSRKQDQYMIIVKDTTREVKQDELENIRNYKFKLLMSISHELRTPLNHIQTSLQQLQDDQDIKQYLKIEQIYPAYCSSELLNIVISDILDFAHMQLATFKMEFETFSLEELFEQIVVIYTPLANIKKINFKVDLDEDLMEEIHSDYERIKQVLVNLISNAFKFTIQGQITVKAIQTDENIIKISVEDTGTGILPQQQKQLFSQFKALFLHNDTEEAYQQCQQNFSQSRGAGIGLTFCSVVVNGLKKGGQQLELKSQYGKGSEFSFYIENRDPQKTQQRIVKRINKRNESFQRSIKNLFHTSSFQTSFFGESDMEIIENEHSSENDTEQYNSLRKQQEQSEKLNIQENIQETQNTSENIYSEVQQQDHKVPSHFFIYNDENNKNQNGSKEPSIENDLNKNSTDQNINNINSNTGNPSQKKSFFSEKSPDKQYLFATNDNLSNLSLQSPYYKQKFCDCIKVLIVDDDGFNTAALEGILLKKFNIKVDKAVDGMKAYEMVLNKQFQSCCKFYNLIIMDIDMPNMNGYEASQKISNLLLVNQESLQTYNNKNYWIVSHTAAEGEDHKKNCKNSGIFTNLKKPLDFNKLKNIIETLFQNNKEIERSNNNLQNQK